MTTLSRFRADVDDFMEFHPQSPLSGEQLEAFAGLRYYDENPDLAFTVRVERFEEDEPLVEMQTNTGDRRYYRRWGSFSFDVGGETATLVVYSDPQTGDFFLPFKDTTNGRETYGAGRYMDSHRPALRHVDDEHLEVDLNYAYNPYCAYSEYYSCPLPPAENWLKVPIRAGEKKYVEE